jgi:hypothetical protein
MIRRLKFKNILLLIGVGLILSCTPFNKKKTTPKNPQSVVLQNYLHLRNGKPLGILRIECADCSLLYSIDNIDSSIYIKNGNQDRFIFPKNNSYLHTKIVSNKEQMIRVLVINPNGEVISNVLDSFNNMEHCNQKFLISYHGKNKNTIVVNSL